MSLSCLETFNSFPLSSKFKVKRLVTDLTKTQYPGLCSSSLRVASLCYLFKTLSSSSQEGDFLLLTSSLSSVPSPRLTSMKALNYPLRSPCFHWFVVSLPHHLCSELRARTCPGFPVVFRVLFSPLIFCNYFMAEPSTPTPSLHGGRASWHPPCPASSILDLSGGYRSRVCTHLTGVSAFRPSRCLTRKHSLKANPPPCGGQEYFRDGRIGERAAPVAAVRGGVGSAGLPGEGGEGWGLGVTGRGAAELPAVFGGLAGLRGWRACLPQAGGWDLPCGRAETGDWPR